MNNKALYTPNSSKVEQQNLLYGCIHIPNYSVEAFIRREPKLRKKPVAVLDGTSPFFKVISRNRLAHTIGVEIGMTKSQLETFKTLTIRYRSRKREDNIHRVLIECAYYFSPSIEDTTTGTITLDLSGLTKTSGTPRVIAQKLFRATHKFGIEAQIAIANNPDAAIHAAMGKSGITVIPAGQEKQRLCKLPLQILSPSSEMAQTFFLWGLEKFGDLARIPQSQIAERLGQKGIHLQKLSCGETSRSLVTKHCKPYFNESVEIKHYIRDMGQLLTVIRHLLGKISQRLEAHNLTVNKLHLIASLDPKRDPIDPVTLTISPSPPTRDPNTLLKFFRLNLENQNFPNPIKSILLDTETIQLQHTQENMFHPESLEPARLALALKRIKSIECNTNWGSPELLDNHQPDAFRMRKLDLTRTSIGNGKSPNDMKVKTPTTDQDLSFSSLPMACRTLRPPIAACVKIHKGFPSHLRFSDKSGKIVASAGPWNSSGQWWRNDAWEREEWDIQAQIEEKTILCRIYQEKHSQHWFVDGIYD